MHTIIEYLLKLFADYEHYPLFMVQILYGSLRKGESITCTGGV